MRYNRQKAEGRRRKAEGRKPRPAYCLLPTAYWNRGFTPLDFLRRYDGEISSHDGGSGSLSQSVSRSKNLTGFTLTELLVAVVVAGVLAAVAVPMYQKTVERNYWRVAGDALMTIYAGERAYFLTNGFYYNVVESGGVAQWRIISMDDPNLGSIPIGYVADTPATAFPPGPQTFTATATRSGGACNAKTRTINQDRVDSGAGQACWSSCGC